MLIFNQILEVDSTNGIHPNQQDNMARKKGSKICLQKRARQYMTCRVLVTETVISQSITKCINQSVPKQHGNKN